MSEPMLYWWPGTCARVTLVALEEIGEPYSRTVVSKFTGDHLKPEYHALNPKGKVPTLVADGLVITENPAIQTYVAARHPEARLLPTEPASALDALSLMSWFAAGVHPSITRLRFPMFTTPVPESFAGIREVARGQLAEAFTILEERLADRPWLLGADWSIVDVYMLWLWFRAVGSGLDGSPFPRCADHAQRVEQRPSVVRALDLEEDEYARRRASGEIPDAGPLTPAHAVGRAPVLARGPAA